MKKLSKYAYLIKHSSYSYNNNYTNLKSDEFSSDIIGVKDVGEAIEVINKLIDENIELVELCGGFTEEEELEIKEKINTAIPIGRAALKPGDILLLKNSLNKSASH